jgi:hypothetical protein
LQLRDVLKVPKRFSHMSIEEFKALIARQNKLTSEYYLKEMIFPKNNIANINLRVETRVSTENIKIGS